MSDAMRARAHSMQSQLIRAMDEVTQRRIAALMGIGESTLSTLKNDHMGKVLEVVAICGFRLVPIGEETFDEQTIAAMRTLAQVGLQRVTPKRGDA